MSHEHMSFPRVTRSRFGMLPDGSEVERVTLQAADGLEASIMTYGASLQALLVPDAAGHRDDIVLGHETFEGYLARRQFFGATVGRYANRIAGARFMLDGAEVQLAANNGANALHGGPEGFDRRNWRIIAIEDGDHPAVTLAYTSADGEEGYPGTLDVEVTWRLAGPMELPLDMTARTDRPTVVNLTNHSFFNLAGARSGRNILDHHLTVAADHFLAIDAGAIPLPQPPSAVTGTPFDFGQASRSAQGFATTIRSSALAAVTITISASARRTVSPALPPGSPSPRPAACSNCSPTSPGCRSIPEIFSMAPPPERAAASIGSPTPCASSRTRGPIRPTGPTSRPHGCPRAKSIATPRCIASRSATDPRPDHDAIETQSTIESHAGVGR